MSMMMCSGECDTYLDTDFCGNWVNDLCYCDNCWEDRTMEANFVTFFSPGTFMAESSTKPIVGWDVDTALEIMQGIKERHNAIPFGFRFTTRSRSEDELDSKISDRSPMYYVGGEIETLAEVEARNAPDEKILRSNMRGNGYNRIHKTTEGWAWTSPLNDDDVVIPSASHKQEES